MGEVMWVKNQSICTNGTVTETEMSTDHPSKRNVRIVTSRALHIERWMAQVLYVGLSFMHSCLGVGCPLLRNDILDHVA